jgi:hypothetical protein
VQPASDRDTFGGTASAKSVLCCCAVELLCLLLPLTWMCWPAIWPKHACPAHHDLTAQCVNNHCTQLLGTSHGNLSTAHTPAWTQAVLDATAVHMLRQLVVCGLCVSICCA